VRGNRGARESRPRLGLSSGQGDRRGEPDPEAGRSLRRSIRRRARRRRAGRHIRSPSILTTITCSCRCRPMTCSPTAWTGVSRCTRRRPRTT